MGWKWSWLRTSRKTLFFQFHAFISFLLGSFGDISVRLKNRSIPCSFPLESPSKYAQPQMRLKTRCSGIKNRKKKNSTITKKPKTKQKKPKQTEHLRFCCCLSCSWSSWIPSQWIFSSFLHTRSKQCTLPWVVHPAFMGAPMVPAESWDPYLVTLLKSALTDGTSQ